MSGFSDRYDEGTRETFSEPTRSYKKPGFY